jgi:ABC-type glycerol-3-phosphate transport system permease component
VQATLPAWLFSRRNAILAALIFALAGAWTSYLVALLVYAAVSFFVVQFIVHRIRSELTAH